MSARPNLRLVPTAKRRTTRQKYLQEPDATGSWRFRRVVPKGLREVIGKGEWTDTLDARTENEAIRLLLPHIQETDRIVALAEAGNWPPIPDEDVEVVAHGWWVAEPGAQTMSSSEVPRSVERFLTGTVRKNAAEFAIQIGAFRGQSHDVLSDRRVLGGPVVAAPGQDVDTTGFETSMHSVPIEFHFMEPVGTLWCRLHQSGEFRLNPGRRCCSTALSRHRRNQIRLGFRA